MFYKCFSPEVFEDKEVRPPVVVKLFQSKNKCKYLNVTLYLMD